MTPRPPEAPSREEQIVLGDILPRNGQLVRVSLYRKAGLPPILGLALCQPRTDGTIVPSDTYCSLRFFPDEREPLRRGVGRALELAARRGWLRRAEEPRR